MVIFKSIFLKIWETQDFVLKLRFCLFFQVYGGFFNLDFFPPNSFYVIVSKILKKRQIQLCSKIIKVMLTF
jgi:hypothetical protein